MYSSCLTLGEFLRSFCITGTYDANLWQQSQKTIRKLQIDYWLCGNRSFHTVYVV